MHSSVIAVPVRNLKPAQIIVSPCNSGFAGLFRLCAGCSIASHSQIQVAIQSQQQKMCELAAARRRR
jgi:hypothetical protein